MRIIHLIIMFGLISFMACKNEKPKVEAPQGTSLPDDFQTFYDNFHTDSVFQMSHIIFPLQGQPSLTDSSAYIPDNFTWSKEKWVMHRPFDNGGGEFKRSFINFNNIITEEIADRSGQFTMIRRFSKMDADWYLIYYKEMGL